MFGGGKKKKILQLATRYTQVADTPWQVYYEELGELLRRAR